MGITAAYYLATSPNLPAETTIWIVDPGLRKDGNASDPNSFTAKRATASFQAGGMLGKGDAGLHFVCDELGELATQSYAAHEALSQRLNGPEAYGYAPSLYRAIEARERVLPPPKGPLTLRKGKWNRLHELLGPLLNTDDIIIDKFYENNDMAQLHPARFCDTLLEASSQRPCRSQ
jgi:hypothetical protein